MSLMICSQIESNWSSVIVTITQALLLAKDTKMVEEFVLVDPYMIDGVPY